MRWNAKRIAMIGLALALAISQIASASPKLTDKQKKLMERGRVKELAKSLTRDAKTRLEKISCLYLFVRDEIKHFDAENRWAVKRVLREGAGRADDKARLLAELMDKIIEEKYYLATINYVKYGEQMTYAFVAIKAKKEERKALSNATGGGGECIRFPIKKKGKFIPLVPLSGYSVGKLSTEFYDETEEGSGKWKKWKYHVSFSKY